MATSTVSTIPCDGSEVSLLDLGVECTYTVPSFSVLSVPLGQTTIQTQLPDGSIRLYDGFVRSDARLKSVITPFCLTLKQHCYVPVSPFRLTE